MWTNNSNWIDAVVLEITFSKWFKLIKRGSELKFKNYSRGTYREEIKFDELLRNFAPN